MDANGTRYALLLGAADWGRCRDEGGDAPLADCGATRREGSLCWDGARAEVRLRQLPYVRQAARDAPPLRLEQRRGAARDASGTWYWIADGRDELRVLPSGSDSAGRFWAADDAAAQTCAPPGAFRPAGDAPIAAARSFRGLCVTDDHHLVVGTLEPSGLLLFDLYTGSPPSLLRWPHASFEPFDLAPRRGGGVWILDRRHRLVWALDRALAPLAPRPSPLVAPVPSTFQPLQGAPAPPRGEPRFERTPPAPAATSLGPIDPIAIEHLDGDDVLVMDASGDLYGVTFGGADEGDARPRPIAAPAQGGSFGHDFAFVARSPAEPTANGRVLGTVYHLAATSEQSVSFDLHEGEHGALALHERFRYLPLRRFGGKALVAAGDSVYFDHGERWLPLVEKPRHAFHAAGTLVTPVLDGLEPGCVWHRLMLDACIPAETEVRVSSRWSDDRDDLAGPWHEAASPPEDGSPPDAASLPDDASPPTAVMVHDEPPLYPRSTGSELPFASLPDGYRTWELLFQRARGRYLQLRLEIVGNGRVSPRLRALRAYHPRFSYLGYLPAVYREEDGASDPQHVLERFLANPEGTLTELEDLIAHAQVLFDPRTAPTEALAWLGRWVGVVLDPGWDEAKRRLFLRHAATFFRYRGTVRGLWIALRLALDECADEDAFAEEDPERAGAFGVRLIEAFRTRVPPASPPLPTPAEAPLWRDFLARRYRTLERLEQAHRPGTPHEDFESIELPTTEPVADAAKSDYAQFRHTLLPMARSAHRFSILLPLAPGEAGGSAQQQGRLELATRIAALESPAHTVFDVRFFWAMFRVGEARLGFDSHLEEASSRVPALMQPMVLGRGHLAQGFLPTVRAPGRWILDQTDLEA